NDDSLTGGKGLDILDGGEGRDTYYFSIGDDAGVTSVVNDGSSSNLVVFTDAALFDIVITGSDTSWLLQYSANDRVQLNGEFEIQIGGKRYTPTDLINLENGVGDQEVIFSSGDGAVIQSAASLDVLAMGD